MPESFTFENYDKESPETLKLIMASSANVVIVYDDTQSLHVLMLNFMELIITWKVWVMNSQWDVNSGIDYFMFDSFHGSLFFAHHHNEIPNFRKYVESYNPTKYPKDPILGFLWNKYFNCSISKPDCKILDNCLPNVSLKLLPANSWIMKMPEESYNIYNSVYAVAHSLHEMRLQQVQMQPYENGEEIMFFPWQVISFLLYCNVSILMYEICYNI